MRLKKELTRTYFAAPLTSLALTSKYPHRETAVSVGATRSHRQQGEAASCTSKDNSVYLQLRIKAFQTFVCNLNYSYKGNTKLHLLRNSFFQETQVVTSQRAVRYKDKDFQAKWKARTAQESRNSPKMGQLYAAK